MRIPLILSVWCLALALPAVAGAQNSEVSSTPRAPAVVTPPHPAALPACDPKAPEPEDWQYLWRLRAFRHLDCVMDIVQHAMTRPRDDEGGDGNDRSDQGVTLSRTELEQIHRLALWARDAAARIGR